MFVSLLAWPNISNHKKLSVDGYYNILVEKNEPFNKSMQDNLSEIIDSVGVGGSIDLLEKAENTGKIDRNNCHALMHLIGHQAWARKVNDLAILIHKYGSVCQSGLPHGIEAQITLQEPDIKFRNIKLKEFCRLYKANVSVAVCFHGVGHAYYQTTRDAKKALLGCDLLREDSTTDLEPCYQGVFSEYGNDILGIDGETGIKVPGPHKTIANMSRPLLNCYQYEQKYQSMCFTTFVMLTGSQQADVNDFSPCLFPEYNDYVKGLCVEYLAAVTARSALSFADSYIIPKAVTQMPIPLQKAYIKGLKGAVFGYLRDNHKKDWQSICRSFPVTTRQYCIDELKNLGEN